MPDNLKREKLLPLIKQIFWTHCMHSRSPRLGQIEVRRKMALLGYLEIFILEHHWPGDVVRILIENNGSVVEGRRRDDGRNWMWRPADVKGSSRKLMMSMVMLLVLVMLLMRHMMCRLVIPQFFARTSWYCGFRCCWSLSYPHLKWTPPYEAVC